MSSSLSQPVHHRIKEVSTLLCSAAEHQAKSGSMTAQVRCDLVDAIGLYHDACELEHPLVLLPMLTEQVQRDLRLTSCLIPLTHAEVAVLGAAISVCLSFGGGVTESSYTARGLAAVLRHYGAQSGSRAGAIINLASLITLNRQVLA